MAVSETVVQILGEPCLLSLLRSSTWNKDESERKIYSVFKCTVVWLWCVMPGRKHCYLTGPSWFVVGLQVFVIVVELRLLFLLLLLQRHQVGMLLLQLPLQTLWLTLFLQLLALILLSKESHCSQDVAYRRSLLKATHLQTASLHSVKLQAEVCIFISQYWFHPLR